MKRLIPIGLLLAAAGGCAFDNVAPPQSELTGRVVYDGQPVNVRQNAVQLELWQDGYGLTGDIPLHVHHDGSFAAMLFDGDYKLVRKQNNGPWANDADTIRFTLRGSQQVEVPVQPYFVIRNASIARSGSTLTASFDVQPVVAGRTVERVALYVGRTQFVDSRYNLRGVENASGATALEGTNTLTLDLAALPAGDLLFARVGVKTTGVEEMIYTPVQEVGVL